MQSVALLRASAPSVADAGRRTSLERSGTKRSALADLADLLERRSQSTAGLGFRGGGSTAIGSACCSRKSTARIVRSKTHRLAHCVDAEQYTSRRRCAAGADSSTMRTSDVTAAAGCSRSRSAAGRASRRSVERSAGRSRNDPPVMPPRALDSESEFTKCDRGVLYEDKAAI